MGRTEQDATHVLIDEDNCDVFAIFGEVLKRLLDCFVLCLVVNYEIVSLAVCAWRDVLRSVRQLSTSKRDRREAGCGLHRCQQAKGQ